MDPRRARSKARRAREQDRLTKLEALADAVRAGIRGLPDHPWIPGADAAPVRDALFALDEDPADRYVEWMKGRQRITAEEADAAARGTLPEDLSGDPPTWGRHGP